MTDSFTISDLAREFAITTRAIRFYEDKELLSPQRSGNTRIYSRADRTRLKLVLRGKRLGWPLHDIKQVLDLYDLQDGSGEILQLEAVITKLDETRDALLAQQLDLQQSLADIDELEANCRRKLLSLGACNNSAGKRTSTTEYAQNADLPVSEGS